MTTNQLLAMLFPVIAGGCAVATVYAALRWIAPKPAAVFTGEQRLNANDANKFDPKGFLDTDNLEKAKLKELLSKVDRARSHFRDMESTAHSAAEELDQLSAR